jgi:lysophospholipase L1-like esterase
VAGTAVHAVSGIVYYDQNASGALDPGEDVRLPAVTVSIGGKSAVTGADGRFTLPDVPDGTRATTVAAESLPPFFRAGAMPSVPVPPPAGFSLGVPLALPIAGNRPNVYMAFGDSITTGDGSRSGRGYRGELQSRLIDYWGRAEVVNEGVVSTRSDEGADRIAASLARVAPAYTLIHYGTNDWNLSACRHVWSCFTIQNLRTMIQRTRAAGSLPVVATIIPANPAYVDRLAEQRNEFIDETNAVLVPMAREEGAVVADLNGAFKRETSDLRSLYTDHVHPNDRGYEVMAAELFRAITRGASR